MGLSIFEETKQDIEKAKKNGCPELSLWIFFGQINGLRNVNAITYQEFDELKEMLGLDFKANMDAYEYWMIGCLADDIDPDDPC